jgi:hypothetical protein
MYNLCHPDMVRIQITYIVRKLLPVLDSREIHVR